MKCISSFLFETKPVSIITSPLVEEAQYQNILYINNSKDIFCDNLYKLRLTLLIILYHQTTTHFVTCISLYYRIFISKFIY